MKEGDSVFVGPATVTEVNGPWVDVAIHGNNSDIAVSPYTLIPDVPNLAQIAHYLAEHPETVDALDRLWRDFDPIETPLFKVERTQLQDTRMLGSFVKAMRGEGGHE